MDGKLLVLCDELPGDYERYSVKDIYFLRSEFIDPGDDSDRLFVCWDAIVPEDRSFIEGCLYFGMTYAQMPADFRLKETGMTDGKHGSMKGSIQEDSYMRAFDTNIGILRASAQRGEDYRGEALDLAAQFPLQAAQSFFESFSAMLNRKGVVRILVAHKKNVAPELLKYRTDLLEAWQMQNRFMRENASHAKVLDPMLYEDFGEVYSRSSDEMLEIYSLPIFGEADDEGRKLV